MKETQKKIKKLTKKGSIVKMSILGFLLIVGILLSTLSFNFPWNNGVSRFNSFASSIQMSMDLKGGVFAIYEADDKEDNLDDRMENTRKTLQTMIVGRYQDAVVTREGNNRIRVEVPNISDPQTIFETIGQPATVKFELDGFDDTITGEHIQSAVPINNYNGSPAVEIRLNSVGTEIFSRMTAAENNGKTMNIVVQVEGQSANTTPITINQNITNGVAVISGGITTVDQAGILAAQIMSGSFDVPLKKVEINLMSPTLGEDVLLFLSIASAVVLVAILAFMIVRYGLLGVMAAFAFLVFAVLTVFGLAVVPWVRLSLAGIGALIVGLGLALDACIVILEKIREEYRIGKSLNASIAGGFHRGFMSMVDTHIVGLIASIVILAFVPGVFKGFGLILLITVLLSMFSCVFIFGKLIKWIVAIVGDKGIKKLRLNRQKGYTKVETTVEQETSIATPVIAEVTQI